MTVKVLFTNGNEMLFGDSYRKWVSQLCEYVREFDVSVDSICSSPEKWISFGGLKWCSPEEFQKQLDDEGKGRNVSEFVFSSPQSGLYSAYYEAS